MVEPSDVYLALDVSTRNIGYAYSREDLLLGSGVLVAPKFEIKVGKKVRVHPQGWLLRCSALSKACMGLVESIKDITHVPYQQWTVVIESPYIQQGKTTAQTLTSLHGIRAIIAVGCLDRGVPLAKLLDVNPISVRSVVSGSTKATKDITANTVRTCFQYPETERFASDDESDALALLSFVLRTHYFLPHRRSSVAAHHVRTVLKG